MSYAVIPHQNIESFPEHPVDHGLNSLSLGQIVIYGNYRTLINGVHHEDIMPDIIFHTSYGEAITMGPSFTFFCAVEHPWWGTGQVTGVMKSWDNDEGTFTVKTTSTQYYPSTIGEANNKYTDGQCHDLFSYTTLSPILSLSTISPIISPIVPSLVSSNDDVAQPISAKLTSHKTIETMLRQFEHDLHIPHQLPTSLMVVLAFIPSIIMCCIYALYQICRQYGCLRKMNRPKSYKRVHFEEDTQSDVDYLDSEVDAAVPMNQ